ncbi:MAG: fumarate hydratase, partial [Methanomicrobiales archaeon]|nr:fumarate hydratase [Methanomicrobiales archaeon]
MHDSAEPPLYRAIVRATVAALKEAETGLPADVVEALQRAREKETNPVALRELDNILANITLAADRNVPLCQDTGVIICYVTLPPTVAFTQGLIEAIREGVKTATIEVPLRPNIVDPLTRKNTGTNTGVGIPVIHVVPGDRFTITVLPKGAGSENVSRSAMLLPSDRKGIRNFVVDTV